MPDIIGNLRLDQNWGYVGVSGAVHQVAGHILRDRPTSEIIGHPDDKYGWAASVGGLFYLPWLGGSDSIGANFVYSKGAPGYATKAGGAWRSLTEQHRRRLGGRMEFTTTTSPTSGAAKTPIQLTNAWSVTAGYEHFWNPRWRTSLYGGYTRVWYDQNATTLSTTSADAAGCRSCLRRGC